jgi:hypothetical protein
MPLTGTALRAPALLLLAAMLAGCGSDRFSSETPGIGPQGAARPAAPPVNMAGRWQLQSPGRGQCNMTFGAAPGAAEGTIAPEGGCPGQFYMSRKWTYDAGGLTIRNHNSEPLAQLSSAGGARFNGQATSGDAIVLAR